MKPVIVLVFLLIAITGYSQPNSLTGKTADAKTGKPLSFVTIALVDSLNNKIKQTFSATTGAYSFTAIPAGIYTLKFSFIGYDSLKTSPFPIYDSTHLTCETIFLKQDTSILAAVTVTSRKPTIETKIDGLIYNAANEPQIAGGSSIDVLRKVPLLSVNQNGEISVAGYSTVRIFIDDKPAELFGMSPADYLAQLPADRIDRVRVITNPSARYDAEGGAVVLIYTKKNRSKNLTGSMRINGGIGDYRDDASSNLNLFYKTGKLGFSFGVGYSRGHFHRENITERRAISQLQTLNQHIYDTLQRNSTPFNFGIDIEIDSLNSFNVNANFVLYDFHNIFRQDAQLKSGSAQRNYSRTTDQNGRNRFPTVSLAYNKRFKKSEKEFTFLTYYSSRNTDLDYTLRHVEQNSGYEEMFNNSTDNNELSLQADYVHPINKKNKIETGIKTLFRKAVSDYEILPYDAARSGSLSYSQNVYAGYGSYETMLGKWQWRSGIRFEQTAVDAQFNNDKVNIEPYTNIIPNIIFARNFKNNHSLSFSFSQSIQRPFINQLNPATSYSDSLNIMRGNPELDPQLTNRIEAAYTMRMKAGSFLRISFYGTAIDNSITQIRRLLPGGIALTSWENIGRDNRIGFSANWNQQLSTRWKMIVVVNGSWTEQRVKELGLYANGCTLFSSLYFNYASPKGFSLDAFVMSRTRSVDLQGKAWMVFPQYYFLTASQRFLKDRLGISLSAESFFTPTQPFTYEYQDATFFQRSTSYMSNRIFILRLNYRFNQKVSETQTRAGSKARSVPVD